MSVIEGTPMLTRLLSSLPALLGLFSADGSCLFLQGSSRLTNHFSSNSSGRQNVSEIFPALSGGSDLWQQHLEAVSKERRTIRLNHPLENQILLVILFPCPQDERDSKPLVGVLALETEEANSSTAGNMLAIVGHELRNPLAAIGAGIKVLEMNGLESSNANILQIIKRQIELASRLVNDLVDTNLAANQNGLPLVLRDELLNDVIKLTLEGFKYRMTSRKHSLSVTLPEVQVRIRCDLNRLSQAITNLLHNASKYTPDGGQIGFKVAVSSSEVVVLVSDNGVGIPASNLEAIFEPFTQIKSSSARADGGVGLGLFLVKSIVEGHGGKINATSPGVDQGSVFEIRIPRTQR